MSPSFLTRPVSKRSLRSLSRATGMISRSAKSRAVSRIRRCSSVSSKSIKRAPRVAHPSASAYTGAHGRGPERGAPMSIRTTESFLREHATLRDHVEHLPVAARELPQVERGERIDMVERITAFLAEMLLPHAAAEEGVLYPQAAKLLGEPDGSDA